MTIGALEDGYCRGYIDGKAEGVGRIAEQDAIIKELVEALEGWQQLFRGYHPDDPVLKTLRDVTGERIARATKGQQ